MTVWLIILFLEGTLVKLLEAECAHKMLRVKFTMHSSDASASDGLLTAVAQSAAAGMVVHLTVGFTLMLKETSTGESLMAFLERQETIIIMINVFFKPCTMLQEKFENSKEGLINCKLLFIIISSGYKKRSDGFFLCAPET